MDGTNRILKYSLFNLKKAVIAFWAVMLIINIASYIMTVYLYLNVKFGISLNGQLVSITGGNFMPIIIFFIAYGIIIYHEDFRLALNFGVTRKNFYKSVIMVNIVSAFIFAVVQTVLQLLDKVFIKNMGLNPVVDIQIHQNPFANFFITIVVLSSIFLFIASLINIVGILQYKYTYKFWIGFGIVALITLSFFIPSITKLFLRLRDLSIYLFSIMGISSIPLASILISAILYTIGYGLFKKVNC